MLSLAHASSLSGVAHTGAESESSPSPLSLALQASLVHMRARGAPGLMTDGQLLTS